MAFPTRVKRCVIFAMLTAYILPEGRYYNVLYCCVSANQFWRKMRITNPQNNRYQPRIYKRVCEENTTLRFWGLFYLWNYEIDRCSAGQTSLLACVASIAELSGLKTFIPLNLFLLSQNTALLRNCVLFGSFNSPSRFLSSLFVEVRKVSFSFKR